MLPPNQDQAAADAEALQRASDQLGDASEAVAAARKDIEAAASAEGRKDEQTRAAEEALEAAEEALADASEKLAEAAEQGGGDEDALNEAIAAAEEALAAAEEALASAEAGAEENESLADAGAPGEEEPLPAEEENPSGGGGSAASAAASSAAAQAGQQSAGGAAGNSQAMPGAEESGVAGDSQAMPGAEESGAAGRPGLVVAVAGARGSLEQGQSAIDSAIRALIITGVYQPAAGDVNADGATDLPAGGVLVLMPGEPGEDEKVARLEGQLEDTLIVIDGRLLEERNRLASQRTGGTVALPGGDEAAADPGAEAAALLEQLGAGDGESAAAGEDMDEIPAGGQVTGGDMDDLGDGKRADNTVRPDNIPEGVPDGSDDDIVARQIREAAMNETDPVLREKLWREYINYKKGGN